MPQAILPIILAVSAATSTGLAIHSAVSQPGQPSQPSPSDITKQAISNETDSRSQATKAAAQFLPGLQYQTSGGLSPDAYQQFSSSFSGNANLSNSPQMQQLVAKFLGLDSGNSFGGDSTFGSGGGASNPISPGLTG